MKLFHSPKNPNAHLTVKERDKPSYPTRILLNKGILKGKILDFGCGLGKDVEFLKSKQFNIQGYDPFYQANYPTEKFDTIICHYVLNVLFPKEQTFVLMAIAELLKPTGKAYFTVRRDLKKEGFRTHFIHQVQTYQCNVRLNYTSFFKTDFCEIYEYQHFNQIENLSAKEGCPICIPNQETPFLTETASFYAIQNDEEVLIISKKHRKDYFELSDREKISFAIILERCVNLLSLNDYKVIFESSNQDNLHFYGRLLKTN
jgi:SAM-dependent methyltransferase